jgi:hypothetical protein
VPERRYVAGSKFSAWTSLRDNPEKPPVSPKERSTAVESWLRFCCSVFTSAVTSEAKKTPYTAKDITEAAPKTSKVSVKPNPACFGSKAENERKREVEGRIVQCHQGLDITLVPLAVFSNPQNAQYLR